MPATPISVASDRKDSRQKNLPPFSGDRFFCVFFSSCLLTPFAASLEDFPRFAGKREAAKRVVRFRFHEMSNMSQSRLSDQQEILKRRDNTVPTLPPKNRQRLLQGLVFAPLALMIWALLLPADWARLFGPLAWPLQAICEITPAAHKLIASSARPELMAGFMGLSLYVPPFLGAYLCRWALFDRQGGNSRLILCKPLHPAWLWAFLWLCCIFALYAFYGMHGRDFAHPRSDYELFWFKLLGKRLFIAVGGSLVTTAAAVACAGLFGFPVRLWARLAGWEQTVSPDQP